MTEHGLEELTRQAAGGDGTALHALAHRLADLLAPLDQRARDEVLIALVHNFRRQGENPSARAAATPQPGRLTPELRAWALQQFTEEEAVAGLRELRERGGPELADFLHELEQAAQP